jgi:predicted DNA-binding transcriptional regulator AlpA
MSSSDTPPAVQTRDGASDASGVPPHESEGAAASLATVVEAVLVPDTVAAALCGISRAHLHDLRSAGKWGPEAIRLGRKVLYRRHEVLSWIDAGCPDAATWRAVRAATKRNRRPR